MNARLLLHLNPLSVNYYDHYDTDLNGTANYSYAAQSLGADEPVATSAQGQFTVSSKVYSKR